MIALRKLGKEIADDAVAAFDAEPKLVALAYRWAACDALKQHLGHGQQPRPRMVRDRCELHQDPTQEADLEAVEQNISGELRRLGEEGIPDLSLEQTHRVIEVMRLVQELKERGETRPSPAIRQRLSRLRKETHLPLDTRLL